jgi:hypothetical protein
VGRGGADEILLGDAVGSATRNHLADSSADEVGRRVLAQAIETRMEAYPSGEVRSAEWKLYHRNASLASALNSAAGDANLLLPETEPLKVGEVVELVEAALEDEAEDVHEALRSGFQYLTSGEGVPVDRRGRFSLLACIADFHIHRDFFGEPMEQRARMIARQDLDEWIGTDDELGAWFRKRRLPPMGF